MTESSTHDSIEQLLPAAALEILEGEELLSVTAHTRDCAACARLIESYREVVAALATTLPVRPLPPVRSARLRERLLSRARGQTAAASENRRTRRFADLADRWSGWAVAAGLAGLLLVHHSVHRPVAYGWLVSGVLTFVILGMAVYIKVQRARSAAREHGDSGTEASASVKRRPTGDTREP